MATLPNPITVKAPARTCLFGDHQDYIHLPVIACAIDRYITLHAIPNASQKLVLNLTDIGQSREIALDDLNLDNVKGDHYLAGIKVVKALGAKFDQGYSIELSGNIAINAGISSSSAVMVAWIRFLLAAGLPQSEPTAELIASLAYKAEVEEQDSPGGRMDQYSISLGKVMYLETGDEAHFELFPYHIPGLIVAESGIPKPTLSLLGSLKEKAWQAIHHITDQRPDFDIATASTKDLDQLLLLLPEELHQVFTAAIGNHEITLKALDLLKQGDIDPKKIGALMTAHHNYLKNYLHITVPLIDDLIDTALQQGALGAKIVGSGLGGSIAVLAPEGKEEMIVEKLIQAGARNAYAVKVSEGVSLIN